MLLSLAAACTDHGTSIQPGRSEEVADVVRGVSAPPSPSGATYAHYTSTSDAFGNVTETWSTDTFLLIGGAFRRTSTSSESRVTGVDGSQTVTKPYQIQYSYNAGGALIAAAAVATVSIPASPSGATYPIYAQTVDAFGSVTETWSSQTFIVLTGQAKLATTPSESRVSSVDGSLTITRPYQIQYSYNAGGALIAATAVATVSIPTSPSGAAYPTYAQTVDAFGDVTETWSRQTFTVVAGQAKLATLVYESRTTDIHGTITITAPATITYT
jgi:hypothetical protein